MESPMVDSVSYPEWFYYPSRTRPPDWVRELLEVAAAARPSVDPAAVDELTSDTVPAHLRPGLPKLRYEAVREATPSTATWSAPRSSWSSASWGWGDAQLPASGRRRPIILSGYRDPKDQLDALHASGRLRLPFEGVLLCGY
jgi:hypothetical protein